MVKEVASKTAIRSRRWNHHCDHFCRGNLHEGLRNVAAGANPMDLKRGLEKGLKTVVEELKKLSKKDRNTKRNRASSDNFGE